MYQCSRYQNNLNVTSKKIRELRIQNNLSLSGLSTKLALIGIDIPKPSLYKIETGNRIVKDYELYAFAYVFNVSFESVPFHLSYTPSIIEPSSSIVYFLLELFIVTV